MKGTKRKVSTEADENIVKKSILGDLEEDYASGDEAYEVDIPKIDRSRSCPYLDTINRFANDNLVQLCKNKISK